MTFPTLPIDLAGQVALVAGATRGAGRAIAVELGAAGGTVYVTGRTTTGSLSPMQRPETIDETAKLVNQAGGAGIAVQVDHADPDQVRSLIERIDSDHGRLDLLVNDIWGGDPLTQWDVAFWEHDLDNGLRLLRGPVETHIITSWHAVPLMIRAPGGLVIEVTDGIEAGYRGSLFYDLAKGLVGIGDRLQPWLQVLVLTGYVVCPASARQRWAGMTSCPVPAWIHITHTWTVQHQVPSRSERIMLNRHVVRSA